MISVLVAATMDTSTSVVASTNTIQIALPTKNKESDVASGSNSKSPNAHFGSSGGIDKAGGAGGVGGNGEIDFIIGGGSGDDCQIHL